MQQHRPDYNAELDRLETAVANAQALALHWQGVADKQREQIEALTLALDAQGQHNEAQNDCISVLVQFVRNPSAFNQARADEAIRTLRCVSSNQAQAEKAPVEETQEVAP